MTPPKPLLVLEENLPAGQLRHWQRNQVEAFLGCCGHRWRNSARHCITDIALWSTAFRFYVAQDTEITLLLAAALFGATAASASVFGAAGSVKTDMHRKRLRHSEAAH